MFNFKPLELAQQVVAQTGDKLIDRKLKDDRFHIVHPTNNKAFLTIFRGDTPAKNVKLPRVNQQNTANCLIMSDLDLSQAWAKHEQFSRGLPKKEKETFEDTLMSVYKHHQIMCQNGYSLWYCDVTISDNCVTVHNEYVVRPDENKQGYEDLEVIEFRAYVNAFEPKTLYQLDKVPSFWVLEPCPETHTLGSATGYMEMRDKWEVQVSIFSTYQGLQPKRRPIQFELPLMLIGCFDIYHVHEMRHTSKPGRVNSIRVIQYTDGLNNARELKIIRND